MDAIIDRANTCPEFETYTNVREQVLELLKNDGSQHEQIACPSEYWKEELSNFDYMIDASPLLIKKLRHHCYHITGLKVYEYRTHQESRKAIIEKRLKALNNSGAKDLIIPESRILGGFGYEIDGELYNVDTLKFTEVLLGMETAGLLDILKSNNRRNLVWEIGAGWGGFPYQFKTLFPDTTYMITDFPELFLFSAVYLKTAFPESRYVICNRKNISSVLLNWENYDFIFIPNNLTEQIHSVTPDIMVNMVSFQEMTEEQVDAYLKKGYELGTTNLYSLNRDCSSYNKELSNVHEIIKKYYILTPLPILGTDYTAAAKGGKVRTFFDKSKSQVIMTNYRHIVGIIRQKRTVKNFPETPRVVLGMPVYNGENYIEEALISILGQTYEDFILFIFNDGSSDQSERLIKEYMQIDKRIIYVNNQSRGGMVNAWKQSFQLVTQKYPSAEYFAWISDHDIWSRTWIQSMLNSLENNKNAVLCYCLTQSITADNHPIYEKKLQFSTQGMLNSYDRFYKACKNLKGAGNMVYGMFRIKELQKAGIFRRLLLPDRNLLFELSLYGEFICIPLSLWFRRKINQTSLRRQRRTLFADDKRPLYVYLPWWVVSFVSFLKNYLISKPESLKLSKISILKLSFCFLFTQAYKDFKKHPAKIYKRFCRIKKTIINKLVCIAKRVLK